VPGTGVEPTQEFSPNYREHQRPLMSRLRRVIPPLPRIQPVVRAETKDRATTNGTIDAEHESKTTEGRRFGHQVDYHPIGMVDDALEFVSSLVPGQCICNMQSACIIHRKVT
jgi:hypothetical protein